LFSLIASGGRAQSPWLWLVIVGGGIGLYLLGRVRGWPPAARSWSEVGDRLFLRGVPWWMQALYCALIGAGSLYHVATGSYRWYWWLLPAVAWLAFAEVVVRRDSSR
jgi:hypothetical protein